MRIGKRLMEKMLKVNGSNSSIPAGISVSLHGRAGDTERARGVRSWAGRLRSSVLRFEGSGTILVLVLQHDVILPSHLG